MINKFVVIEARDIYIHIYPKDAYLRTYDVFYDVQYLCSKIPFLVYL